MLKESLNLLSTIFCPKTIAKIIKKKRNIVIKVRDWVFVKNRSKFGALEIEKPTVLY